MNAETLTRQRTKGLVNHFRDIYLEITWSKIAKHYFPDKSVSWFYGKMRGEDGNGGDGEFTLSEKMQLRNALLDFSDRVRNAANSLEI